MAGIYIHIPFCRQACSYCNFHFTTSLRRKNELVAALLSELGLRKEYLGDEIIETIYFGGGTPGLLDATDMDRIMVKISSFFEVKGGAEVTIEANPDDIGDEKLRAWKNAGINRLSIGVQSFFDKDLQWMNRAHDSAQAHKALRSATDHFDNISIDLIYGSPSLTNENWKENLDQAITYDIGHLSCYALTIEPKTRLHKMIRAGNIADVDPGVQSEQFMILMEQMEQAGYEHYEISNFAKPGFRSRHNSSYWFTTPAGDRKRYLGIGPSAHSYNGKSRQWNVANNSRYIESISKNTVPFEMEVLNRTQQINEFIMTSLRTKEGLDLGSLNDAAVSDELRNASRKFIERDLMVEDEGRLKLTRQGKLLADGIAADLFFTDRQVSG